MITIYTPRIPFKNMNNFIQTYIFNSPKVIQNTIQTILTSSNNQIKYIDALNLFLRQIDDENICSKVDPLSKDFIKSNLTKFITNFINVERYSLSESVIIPPYNMFHFGMNCHLNVCFNVLISIAKIFIPYYKTINDTDSVNITSNGLLAFKCILDEIFNNISPININPNNIHEIIGLLNINANFIGEANETFKTLMKELYKMISLNDILYWDSADTFIQPNDVKLSLDDLIDKYSPKYLIVNAQDYNVMTKINNNKEVKIEHKTIKNRYIIHSCVLSMSGHFTSVFRNPDKTWVIRNDLNHRCDVSLYKMHFNIYPIVIALYVNVNEL